MSQLDFDAPLSQYFFEDVSEHLKSNEIYNLDDLMDLIYINDNNWWKSVHLEKETANGILKWLYDHRLEGVELPDSVLKKAIELTKPYYGHKIGVVAGAQFTEVVNPETHFKKVPQRAGFMHSERSQIVPLESFKVPDLFNGREGTNRGDKANCQLSAEDDLQAIHSWLKARGKNQNTQAAYKKEAERFLLWAIIEKRTALSSLTLEDCAEYLTWLEMLGRSSDETWGARWNQPQSTWLGPKNTTRSSGAWRPFSSALSYSSRKIAMTVVRQLFKKKKKTGYLKMNPFDQISPKIPLLPGEGKPKEYADRSLSKEQWDEILAYLEAMPESIQKARLKVILLLGKGLGMRCSEMINARSSWIAARNIGGSSVMFITVIGKGDKERRLPLSNEQVKMISDYLELRNLPPLGDEAGSQSLLLASMRKSKKNLEGGVTRSGLYVILSNFLGDVADHIKKERPLDAAKLRTSSTHWLRHTFAVTSLEVMPVNVVQTALGHASVGTTSKYIIPDEQTIVEALKKKPDL